MPLHYRQLLLTRPPSGLPLFIFHYSLFQTFLPSLSPYHPFLSTVRTIILLPCSKRHIVCQSAIIITPNHVEVVQLILPPFLHIFDGNIDSQPHRFWPPQLFLAHIRIVTSPRCCQTILSNKTIRTVTTTHRVSSRHPNLLHSCAKHLIHPSILAIEHYIHPHVPSSGVY